MLADMARFANMTLPIRQTIADLGITAVAKATGFPTSTIFRWMKKDKVAGKGLGHDLRYERFEAAVKKLLAKEVRRPRRKRAA
jgi:hypothetical protein